MLCIYFQAAGILYVKYIHSSNTIITGDDNLIMGCKRQYYHDNDIQSAKYSTNASFIHAGQMQGPDGPGMFLIPA